MGNCAALVWRGEELRADLAQDLHLVGLDLSNYVLGGTEACALDRIKRGACSVAPHSILLTAQLRHCRVRRRNSRPTDEWSGLVRPPVPVRGSARRRSLELYGGA